MSIVFPACVVLVSSMASPPPAPAAAETERTVYVTVTDRDGGPVTDLTAADFTVKEGGKDRVIARAEPATTPIRLALVVEERLVADGAVRVGLFEFVKRVHGSAEVALILVGIRNETVVDYSSDLNTFVNAINKLALNPTPLSNLTEGILSIAQIIEKEKPERPVMVVLGLSGGQAGGPSPNHVLTQLRQSRVTMHAVTAPGGGEAAANPAEMADSSGREQVLGDGTKQTGGRRHEITTGVAVPKALQQVANDLLAQYVITYTLPDGVKTDRRLSVSVKRRGVTLRAPSGIADR